MFTYLPGLSRRKLDSFAGPGEDQEEGGELDSYEEVRLSFAGPGERREVSWTITKKVRLICESRRDQEEGGELDSHEEI